MQFRDPSVAEVLASRNFDWVAVDLEHGTAAIADLPDICRAIELYGKMSLARMDSKDPFRCKRAMDSGLSGLIVPMIETAAEIERIRESISFPPSGKRGVGFSRANLFGEDFESHLAIDQKPFLVAMVESREGVMAIDDLVRVDGLDAILLGPYDLSASLGSTGDFQSEAFVQALDRVNDACRSAKIPLGIHVVEADEAELQRRIDEGFTFLPFSIDAVFLRRIGPRT